MKNKNPTKSAKVAQSTCRARVLHVKTMKLCSKCKAAPQKGNGQRYCLGCHAAYMREKRAAQKKERTELINRLITENRKLQAENRELRANLKGETK